MANESGPLSKEQIDGIIENIRALDKVALEIDKARRAGLDVVEADATMKDTREKLMKLKNVYAPNRSI